MASNEVGIVIVTFNSATVLPACLNSLPASAKLVIIDNASRDETRDIVRSLRPDATLIAEPVNRGFGTAANIGFRQIDSEFGLLLNADVRLQADMVERLIAAAARYPKAGMMAPTAIEHGKLFFGRTVFFSKRRKPRQSLDAVPEGDICTDYVGGSAMFFRMPAFRAIGGFDEKLFLFYEDDDLCLRMKQAGHELIQIYDARLDHLGGQSTAKIDNLEYWKQFHMAWSRMHVERKHAGALAALAYLGKEAVNCAAKYLLRPRDKCRVRYAARLAGLTAYVAGRSATDIRLGKSNQT